MMADTADPSPIRNATAEEVRALLDGTKLDALTLLDVRMEPEYAEFHLPGAKLLPLPDLPDHLG
uniref:rhodanese-like domain-containing protein n=1 Tax=Solidesulfovibrio sp. TaxID=2910990 RepID=UPI0026089E08